MLAILYLRLKRKLINLKCFVYELANTIGKANNNIRQITDKTVHHPLQILSHDLLSAFIELHGVK